MGRDDPHTGALAAIVCHELNNLAVPMEGFTDFAIESFEGNEAACDSLKELQISINRIKSLAADLESLGEPQSALEVISVGKCLPEDDQGRLPSEWDVSWQCNPTTPVKVDLLQAQRAIVALGRLSGGRLAQAGSIQLTVLRQRSPARRCAACHDPVARDNDNVVLQLHGAGTIRADALTHPLLADRPTREGQRLTMAVLVHCAHAAGGHLLLEDESSRVGLVLPAT